MIARDLIGNGTPCTEWLPEFGSLTETEQAVFEGPGFFGAEYPADTLNYLKPAVWEYLWLVHPRALDLNLGSTGAAHFQLESRLKVPGGLSGSKDILDRAIATGDLDEFFTRHSWDGGSAQFQLFF